MPGLRDGVVTMVTVLAGVASAASHLVAQSGPVVRGWRVAPGAAIKIHVPTGALVVEGWGRDSVELSGTLAAGETVFGGGSLTGLKLGAEGTATGGVSRLRVRVPVGARLVVRSGAADVEVRGVTGSIDVGSAAGDIVVSGDVESVNVESISGSLRVAATATSVRARTTKGSLDITGRIAEGQLTSVSGAVSVSGQAMIGRLRIETVDGRVSVRGRLAATGSLDIETFGGPVQVEFPDDQRAALDLRASGGEIGGRLAAPASGSTAPIDLASEVTRTGTTVTVVRTAGVGSGPLPPVTVRTFRGRITVDAVRPKGRSLLRRSSDA